MGRDTTTGGVFGRLVHMERVPARAIPRCKDLKTDISTGAADWRLPGVPPGN
jgi:hypothetical protein